jgi:hypothetical protein
VVADVTVVVLLEAAVVVLAGFVLAQDIL